MNILETLVALMAAALIALATGTGPAPNSGDGVPDGSGITAPVGVCFGPGAAPNSGDGIPDGSGF